MIVHADCRAWLPTLEENSVDAVVTDPPYELGFMGKEWDQTGIAYDVDLWRAVLRVMKPGAHLLAFGGARTYHRLACAVEDAGFEIRDQIMWVYGTGFPKGHNLSGDWDGWGTGLKPAHEPIVMARKPFKGTVAGNLLEWGTGAINVDGCRVAADDLKASDYDDSLRTAPKYSGVFNGGKVGQYRDRVGVAPAGRWPANLVHDGSDEVMGLFPESGSVEKRTRKIQFQRPGANGIYGRYGGIDETVSYPGSGSAARFFYCAKASKAEREIGLGDLPVETVGDGRKKAIDNAYQWGRTSRRNVHPTVKPLALMRWLVRLVVAPGGMVLDPFCGSGSTGMAAKLEGLDFLGCEERADYCEIARLRIKVA